MKKMLEDDPLEGLMSARDCRVILKETATSYIVKTDDGEKVNIETNLPDVSVGNRGKVFKVRGRYVFIREPYGA